MENSYEKFAVNLESDKGLKELLKFLRQKQIEISPQDEQTIVRRLLFARRQMGFKSYSKLLDQIYSNQETYDNLLFWMQKEDHNVNQSYTPLRKHKKTLKEYAKISPNKKKKRKKKQKIDASQCIDYLLSIKEPTDLQFLPSVMDFLSKKNINYQAYKKNYFLRRLQIRMRKVETQSYREYRKYLEMNPKELSLLVDCLSVNVTRFFRDKELFIKLEHDILPNLLVDRSKMVQIWSAGCAVGPEPYSIAIMIMKLSRNFLFNNVNILATDISQEFLNQAKTGCYTRDYLSEMDPSLIQKYFTSVNQELFEFSSQIRSIVEFKKHDLRTRPPAHGFDLIMCRNVLIYFSKPQSVSLFQRFHSVLNSHGYLVLGKCELLPPSVREKFEIIDAHNRIYQRKN
ncbi:MAG: CheR family methyltransferase [Candidatus Hodarchaeales archaeon]|jgi:chemotaxis protein methyltransferase CheR